MSGYSPRSVPHATWGEKARLLLVEDSRADAFLVQFLARSWRPRVEVEVVTTGEEALHRLNCASSDPEAKEHALDPQLVLLDLNLPRLSGHDVLRAVRQARPERGFPIVVFSSSSDEREANLSLQLGADDFVTKPNDLSAFEMVIKELLTRWSGVPYQLSGSSWDSSSTDRPR